MLKNVTQTAQNVVSGGKQVDSVFSSENSYSPVQKSPTDATSSSPKASQLRNVTTAVESAPSGLDSLGDNASVKPDLEEKPLTLDTMSGLDAFLPDNHEEITSPPIATTSTAPTAAVVTLEDTPKSEPVEHAPLHIEVEQPVTLDTLTLDADTGGDMTSGLDAMGFGLDSGMPTDTTEAIDL